MLSSKEKFLNKRQRYQPVQLPHEFSDEEMARDWTLSQKDQEELGKFQKKFRLFMAIQLCAIQLYGRFLIDVNELSPRIVNYLNSQLHLPPSLSISMPQREATLSEQRKSILSYLGFSKYDGQVQDQLKAWLEKQAQQGSLPGELFLRAEGYLLSMRVVLPGPSVLERLIIHICASSHEQLFKLVHGKLPDELKSRIDELLSVPEEEQRSLFYLLKPYPPSATILSIQNYLEKYHFLEGLGLDLVDLSCINPAFRDYLYRLAGRYYAKDLRRFHPEKRYCMMVCFLWETRRNLLDNLVKMHDQYIMELVRQCKNIYEKKQKELRKRQRKATDTLIYTTQWLMDWPDNEPLYKTDLWKHVSKSRLAESLHDLYSFKEWEEGGYGEILLRRYPHLRRYFSDFVQLPFEAKSGSEPLLQAINLVRQLDSGQIKKLPDHSPTYFIPRELRASLKGKDGKINRNVWEMGLAIAIKEALRAGDLYLPASKEHISFWNLLGGEETWEQTRQAAYQDLEKPYQDRVKSTLIEEFGQVIAQAEERFTSNDLVAIQAGRIQLKKYDKLDIPESITKLQKTIDASMPTIRIEQLLMEVDRETHFTRYFTPIQQYHTRPPNFYKTLISALISQATNLGVVSMSLSVKDISVEMLRHVLQFYIREETIKLASAELVNEHHQLPFSQMQGTGSLSSSDGQYFKIRADSLLAAYYPRYYGYYEKAIGIYTHVSDQYAVYSTRVISCNPREALYVLDGILENNTILKIRAHTTDTHGYSEIVFALCYLLGYYFMPRIRDLKDQQLYRLERNVDYGTFTPLLTKTVDLELIQEQWDSMVR